MSGAGEILSSVRREGDRAIITLSMDDVHALRVALAPCPCRAPKSTATAAIRESLSRALGMLQSGARHAE